MSVNTWKKEFYSKISPKMTDKERAEHTLKKYEGILSLNLKKHGVKKDECDTEIYHLDENINKFSSFVFDTTTCSFCRKYFKTTCDSCPVTKESGESCISSNPNVYILFTEDNNPKPMIKLMKKIIKKCDEAGKYIE